MPYQPQPQNDLDLNPTARRIITSAHECFENKGLQRTSIEDIAEHCGISRQTVYKYFSGKQAIIEAIALRETVAIGQQIRAQTQHEGSFADRLTEALFVSVESGRRNSYVRMIVEDPSLMPRTLGREGELYNWQLVQWQHFLASGRRSGELTDDLDDEAVVRWLSMCQLMMLISVDRLPDWQPEMRPFIRRFVVEPLLSRRIDPREAETSLDLLAEVRALRDLVSAQTALLQQILARE